MRIFIIILLLFAGLFYVGRAKERLTKCPPPAIIGDVTESRIKAALLSCSFQNLCTASVDPDGKICREPK